MSRDQRSSLLSHTETYEETAKLNSLAAKANQGLKDGIGIKDVLEPEEIDLLQKRYSTFKDEIDEQGFIVSSSHA